MTNKYLTIEFTIKSMNATENITVLKTGPIQSKLINDYPFKSRVSVENSLFIRIKKTEYGELKNLVTASSKKKLFIIESFCYINHNHAMRIKSA